MWTTSTIASCWNVLLSSVLSLDSPPLTSGHQTLPYVGCIAQFFKGHAIWYLEGRTSRDANQNEEHNIPNVNLDMDYDM